MIQIAHDGCGYLQSLVHCSDNMLVIHNMQQTKSLLKKKSNLICYDAVRESVAMGELLPGHIGTNENVGNLTTKALYGKKQRYRVSQLLYDIYNE